MKKRLLFSLFTVITYTSFAQGYNIKLTSNYKKGVAYLAYHLGKNYLLQDSAAVSPTGISVFKANKKLPAGIYAVVLPGNKFIADFLIENTQTITIIADTNKMDDLKVVGSPANDLFKAYQAFVFTQSKKLETEKIAYKNSTTKLDSALHLNNYKQYSNALNAYREDIVKNKPTSMMAALLTALKEPAYPSKLPVTKKDSLDNYNFYKQHYWDGITFMDDRIIRTPFFLPKLETYYREVMPQSNDSLIKDIDYRLLYARSSPEMYKFLLNWFTDEYLNPKFMGQDAIFVHLFEKYHSQGLSPWLSDIQQKGIARKAYLTMSNLVGEKAANLAFTDTAGKIAELYNVNASYTVVVFWDPSCGHCKEVLPKIDSFYRAQWQKQNIKIYAVLTEKESQKQDWLKYINENKIGDWVNVYQTQQQLDVETKELQPSYRQLFDISQTPTLYLLDKDKNIIAKKLTLTQMNDLLQLKIKNNNAN